MFKPTLEDASHNETSQEFMHLMTGPTLKSLDGKIHASKAPSETFEKFCKREVLGAKTFDK